MSAGWYLRRLSRMTPAEVAWRTADEVRKRRWRSAMGEATWLPGRTFTATLPPDALGAISPEAAARVITTADGLMDGHAEFFGVARHDLVNPDWSADPRTGRRAPDNAYAFDIRYRDEQAVGDIKQIWEPSRHQHLTVLAAAYALTGEDHYARRVADHLKSWWAANPPLRGVHWVSGIELGIRLLSWVWVRRLLDGWPEAPALFEGSEEALHQIWHHQHWLAAFRSRGSSANNHVIAEAAGRLAAACAFPWFPETPAWRADAARSLDRHLGRNTFPSGVNRELASEYHGLVLELGLAAAAEASVAGVAVPRTTWLVLRRMTDTLAAVVDTRLRPPRQGDSDDGHGLVLDGTDTDRWASLLATGDALFGSLPWGPVVPERDVRTTLLAALAQPPALSPRAQRRESHFADAGLTMLRTGDDRPEIWCRCDGGPHGFLSIAAHAHADALSVEVRHDGVDVLADPGTYCYHGEPAWRSYFRSTLGHNTLELHGTDQSLSGGPFLWTRHAHSHVLRHGDTRWQAEHHGYATRRRPAVHRRTVELDPDARVLTVHDQVLGGQGHPARLAFHLGAAVTAELSGERALLRWAGANQEHTATMTLPAALSWSAHRGETDPPLGWYSPGFGRRVPATTLIGSGTAGAEPLITRIHFTD